MPAKGYQYYEVNSYPDWNDGYVFRTTHQETISGDFDIAPQTVITAVGIADLPSFKKYHVLHETYQKVRGRYKNEPITGYIAQVEFHIYYHTEQKRLLIDTPRNICREMVDRLEKSDIDFLVIPHKIDLSKLGIDLSDRVRGGWFGELKVADVSTIGLFGPTVGESEEWEKYDQVGTLRAIDVELDSISEKLLVKIMAHRGIVLFENLTESQSLERVLKIQHDLDSYEIHD
jgi:hypothetical protein